MNILYIDDDPDDVEIFLEALHVIDPKIICNIAHDGIQGLQILRELVVPPDYIFVDINMPRMTGKEFLYEIKKSNHLKSIPVIMFSTTSSPLEIKQYFKVGAYAFIVKPYNFGKLCEALKSVFASD